VMDMSFANQFMAMMFLARNKSNLENKVYDISTEQDQEIAALKLSTMNIDVFDKILFFYPTVFGIETAATRPSAITKLVTYIPVVGQAIAPSVLEANTYDTRLGAVSLHARLVDTKTGKIEWMKVFQGQNQKKITSGSVLDIILPK